ncbi:hypothetical protein HDU96_006645 [Phlyctochytrium bullatum]|nr:hypothetical protein HDU96_006645 [Phlyctochytrium bullatum]
MHRRVVVTGLGLVTPLGTGVSASWTRLIAGQTGIVSLKGKVHEETGSRYDEMPSLVAGLVPRKTTRIESDAATTDLAEFDLTQWVPKTDYSKTSPFMHFAYAATQQALDDAGWHPTAREELERTGVSIGSGIGCIDDIASTAITFASKGLRKVSPFFVPRTLVNMAAGNISIRHGFQGPNHAVSTACATGAHALGDAMRFIQYGDADVMVAGGTESSISPLAMSGFCKSKSLSTKFNDRPSEASRPFDTDRDGFVIGEGAGVVVLEELEHARRRGARIYAELSGYGLTGDANHITSPPDDGHGARRAMRRALEVARVAPEDVGYVNAHATSTSLGDAAEARSILSIFKPGSVAVSSTKGAIGHLLGAAGAVEAIFTVLALHHNTLPATCNLATPDPGPISELDHVRGGTARVLPAGREIRAALTNSFGFGGTNASLCFTRVD